MTFSPERWCALPPWARGLCWLVSTLLLAGAAWLFWLLPPRQQMAAAWEQAHLQQQHLAARWREARVSAPADEMLSRRPPPALPFSPLDFHIADARLVSWQPAEKGGVMTLETAWQAVPQVFPALAQRGMAATAFSIRPGEGGLNFTLQLESDDGG